MKVIGFRVSPELLQKLQDEAARKGLSVSDIIRLRILASYAKERRK